MSSLNSLYIKKEALETLLKGVNAKGLKGIEVSEIIKEHEIINFLKIETKWN